MQHVIPNHNASLEILSAFQLDQGDVIFERQPVLAFALEDGQVSEVIGLEAPTTNEARAIVDARSNCWWIPGDASGSTLEQCKARLATQIATLAEVVAPPLKSVA